MSATGPSDALAHTAAGGFTLVECLAVLLVIGVILGCASLAGPLRGEGSLAHEAARFANLMRAAQGRAGATQTLVGIDVDDGAYRLVEHRGASWQAAATDAGRARRFGAGIEFLGADHSLWATAPAEGGAPDVMFSPAWDMPPPPVTLRDTRTGTRALISAVTPADLDVRLLPGNRQ